MVPKDFLAWKVPAQIQTWNQTLGLGKNVFYSVGGLFHDHWDPVFHYKMEIQPLF